MGESGRLFNMGGGLLLLADEPPTSQITDNGRIGIVIRAKNQVREFCAQLSALNVEKLRQLQLK